MRVEFNRDQSNFGFREPNPSLFSTWPDNQISSEIFPDRIWQSLDELVGARFFITKTELTDDDVFDRQTQTHLLASMQTAIDKQTRLIQANPDNHQLEEQFSRLVLEHYGMGRVVDMVRKLNSRSSVVWLSPPGLGLDSNETRVNLFWRQGKIVHSISLVASANIHFSLALFESLGHKLPNDATISTSGFLVTPIQIEHDRNNLIKLVEQLNGVFGYRPAGFGVNLDQLSAFVEDQKNKIRPQEITFLMSAGMNLNLLNRLKKTSLPQVINEISRQKYSQNWEESIKLILYLFNQLIKPWLFLYTKNNIGAEGNDYDYDQMAAFLLMNTTGCGGLFANSSDIKALSNSLNPFNFLTKGLLDLLGIKTKIKGCLDD